MGLFGKAERDYFIRKLGANTPTESLNNIKRKYFLSLITGTPRESIESLEKRWLVKVITDAGGTATVKEDASSLWSKAVDEIGQTPSKHIIDNKLKFYLNAP